MNERDVLRRLGAFAKGRPVPRGSTIHYPGPRKGDLQLAFVRMGGESSPWGVAWATGNWRPKVLTVPEPRNRDAVAEMMNTFAPVLLQHLGHPDFGDAPPEGAVPPPVWLPNPTHVAMLHFIAIAYTFAKKGDAARVKTLNALGRAATWLFVESQRPGQQSVLDATDVLRESFTFPCDDVRQAHLGYLLAWLQTKGTIEARLGAASKAERESVATSLDPELEKSELERLVEANREAGKAENPAAAKAAAIGIDAILRRELLRRIDLVSRARQVLSDEPREQNPGLGSLLKMSSREFGSYAWRESQLKSSSGESFVPSPITDLNPIAAAKNFKVLEASAQVRGDALIHHDDEMLQDAIAGGDAFSGRIVKVWDEGTTRSTVPVWAIDCKGAGPLRLREGSAVCVVGLPSRDGWIRRIDLTKKGRRIEVEIEGWKNGPAKPVPGLKVIPAADGRHVGQDVAMLGSGPNPMILMVLSKAFDKGGPGSWLVHSKVGETNQSQDEEGRP